MKKFYLGALVLGLIAISCFKSMAQETGTATDDQWPREIRAQNTVFKMYQPQLDSWDGYTLKAHSAIAVQKGTEVNKFSYGVVNFTLNTTVDKAMRMVNIENVQILSVTFPSDPQMEEPYLTDLRAAAPITIKSMSLDRLEANLQVVEEQKKGSQLRLNNSPPKIIFSKVPAILTAIDGDPVLADVKGTNLQRVINTGVLILKDRSGEFYLHLFDGYLEAANLNGPWTAAKKIPADAKKAEEISSQSGQIDLLQGEADPETGAKPSLKTVKVPDIYVSYIPAELIVSDGEPNYIPIEETNLLYVSNTSADVFKDLNDQKTYVLISGRWFRSVDENGPWEYVSGNDLPKDFSEIPDQSAKENVKATVPGTYQSKEALIENNIPTTSKVERKSAKITLEIDGSPILKPINGTPLYYVFNCSIPVIKISDTSWYALFNGAWFVSSSIAGPWSAAESVPAVIYSIPVNAPLHYVTYVRVYKATPDYIYVGYTSGYYGTVVSADGTVVYGTGYIYPSYIGAYAYYPCFFTYGYGSNMCWTPWYGWSFTFGFGWGYRYWWYYPPAPCFGPFFVWRHHFRDRFRPWELNTSGNVFHRFERRPGKIAGGAGAPIHFGRAYNSATGRLIYGNKRSVENIFTAGTPGVASAREQEIIREGRQKIFRTQGPEKISIYGKQRREQKERAETLGVPSSRNVAGGQNRILKERAETQGVPSSVNIVGSNERAARERSDTLGVPSSRDVMGTNEEMRRQRNETIHLPEGRISQPQTHTIEQNENNVFGTPGGRVYSYEQNDRGGNWQNMNAQQPPAPQGQDYENMDRERGARNVGNTRAKAFRKFHGEPAGGRSGRE